MPARVLTSTPQINRFHYCRKGNKHAKQPLNLVCLDPICRNNPLICPTCFSDYHKYHKTTHLNQFIADYQGTINRNHKHSTLKRINKEHLEIQKSLHQFKNSVLSKLNLYQETIQEYFRYLKNSLDARQQLSKTLNVTLDPKGILNARSPQEIQESVSFIINYSLFDPSDRLINVSSILKHDQNRTLALLDKLVNQNQKIQGEIQNQLNKLDFVQQTLAKQSLRIQQIVHQFNQTKRPEVCSQPQPLIVDPKNFFQKETLNSTLKWTNVEDNFVIQKLHDLFTTLKQSQQTKEKMNQTPLFVFSNVHKHEKLIIVDKDKQSTLKSNVTAIKPQYALICPSVDYQPQKEQNWSIKIKSCRNFASSKNTIAVGLCSLNEIEGQKFEQNPTKYMKNQYILTSEGVLVKNGREDRCNLTFRSGDILDLKYDRFYRLLTIRKDNGRKVTIKIDDKDNESQQDEKTKLYPCVRLTYASDQVQILNHINQIKH